MLCIWADYPGTESEATVVSQTASVISGFGSALPAKPAAELPGLTITSENRQPLTVNGTTRLTASETATWSVDKTGVVELASADAVASYALGEVTAKEVTVTAVGAGTATITIGNTNYHITVEYATKTINVVVGEKTTVTVSGALTQAPDTSVATVSVSGTTMTVTGVSEGDTTVIVGNTEYTIHASKEDLNAVTTKPKLEFWITNAPISTVSDTKNASRTNTENKSYTIYYKELLAAYPKMNTEDGVAIADFAPDSTAHENRTIYYWHSRILDTTETNTYGNELGSLTNDGGDDETDSGSAFTRIRHYGQTWSVLTTTGWVPVETKHQLVAYYKEYLQVTDEIGSYAADWGNKGDGRKGGWLDTNSYCTLSVQVVYEDGTPNPTGTSASDLTAKSFVYGYWDDKDGRGIGTVILNGNDQYEIYKVTAETGASTVSFGTDYATTITNLTWDKNELTVWEDANGSDEAVVHNPSNNFSTKDEKANLCWDENKEAILLRVYIRAKVTPDSLTVHYIDAKENNFEFYHYNIAVKNGVTFDSRFALVNGKLEYNTVTNLQNVTQTVKDELKEMTEIGAKYRYANYDCINVELQNGNKDVYLYYNFDRSAAFVVDFGLPISIPLTEINANLASATITAIKATGMKYGDVTVSSDLSSITYTPTKPFGASYESLELNVSGTITVPTEDGSTEQKGNVSYEVVIYPASNVLYEQNFFTQGTEASTAAAKRHSWTESTHSLGNQATQKLSDTTQRFGYDDAYKNLNTSAGAWTVSGLSSSSDASTSLSTTFTGTGFDLIGSCGPNTGLVMLTIRNNATGKYVRTVIIDTRYTAGTIDQVPLAHLDLGSEDTEYTAIVNAFRAPTTSAASTQSTMRRARAVSYDALTAALNELDLSGVEVEYITMEDVLNAETASSAAAVYAAPAAVAAYALEDEAAVQADETGSSVTIDGFRVYRATSRSSYSNLTNEYNAQYVNILDAVNSKTITAYIDDTDNVTISVDQYEKAGGPQNEIYLSAGSNSLVAITLVDAAGNAKANTDIQVSLSAVNGATAYNDTALTSTTEMYYTLKSDENGIVTIKNTGTGMLTIGNVKLPDGVTAKSPDETDSQLLLASVQRVLAAAKPFEPATFDAKATSVRLFRSKIVTLRITVSKDVSYVTVNGKTYRPTGFFSRWVKNQTILVTDTVGRKDSQTYEIIAFDADGSASAPVTVIG